jgi:hypothetical protein
MLASSPTVSKLKASKVLRMKEEELAYVVTEYDLDIDISESSPIKSSAVGGRGSRSIGVVEGVR